MKTEKETEVVEFVEIDSKELGCKMKISLLEMEISMLKYQLSNAESEINSQKMLRLIDEMIFIQAR
ncbi:hypothetical protein [Sporosarcina highlanderae]|uniref:Uncharacterized protein n=1 Tax=Sporosarcina highlanderae TaxID=3035916 RepID=A0ABT8JQD4_9BACL|nr:hypothetical protein [Sporosarcina highlanderae]MDN4607370.1 hypothetical protein [Sporosarcina highlanderae]